MTAHKKRLRAPRALVIAGCMASLAAPTAASAMIPRADAPPPVRHENFAVLEHKAPVYVPPPYAPDSFAGGLNQPGVKSGAPSSPTSVVREVQTVDDDGDGTLAIVLAASALGITLCGTGFALIRVSRMQRGAVA